MDDKIELNRRMNETLEAMARALFKSWFVDFDPVRAKAEGRDTGLPRAIADLFPDGSRSRRWGRCRRGGEVVSLPGGDRRQPDAIDGKGEVAPYLDMANMPTCGHRPSPIRCRAALGSGMRFINGDTSCAYHSVS